MTRIVVILVCLLTIVLCGENPELKLISELNNYFDFDHNIFLLESSVDINHFISAEGLLPRNIYMFKDVNENTTEMDTLQEIRSKNAFTIVGLNGSSFDRSFSFFKRLKAIQPLQFNIKIAIFFQQFVSEDDLRKLFEWCRERLIAHVFAASYVKLEGKKGLMTTSDVLNIFTFEHFGTLNVINVTTSERFEAYFPGLQSNLHQFDIGIYYNVTNNEYWFTIYKKMNISTEDNKLIDWNYTADRFYVYPKQINTMDLLVPHAVPYDGFSAYIQLVATDKFIGVSMITIATVIFALTTFRYIKKSKTSFFQTVADVFNLLMNDNGSVRYQRLSRAEVLVIAPLTFVGLVVMNGILSIMQSYLTEPVLQPQIKTLEDLYRSPFHIVAYYEETKEELIKEMESITKQDWSDKIISIDADEFWRQVDNFNSSISFTLNRRLIDYYILFQKRFNVKAYYDPKITVEYWFDIFGGLPKKFMFFERLNEINHRMTSAGLFVLWERVRADEEIEKFLTKNPEILNKWKEEQDKNPKFEFPSLVIYGWIVSVIVFIVEMFWSKIKFAYSRIKRLLIKS